MEEDEDHMPPFWLQTSDALRRADRRRRRSSPSSLFLNSGLFLVFLLIIVILFIFIIIPSFLSFTSQIFRPHLVKKSWDSLNLVLVVFAIFCGFLSRNTASTANTPTTTTAATVGSGFGSSYEDHKFSRSWSQKSNPSSPHQLYDQYSDRTAYNSLRRLRSSSSYPDLRQQESSWASSYDRQWRFFDDTHLSNYGAQSFKGWKLESDRREENYNNTKDIAVDTLVIEEKVVVASTPPEAPPPPPPRSPSPPPQHPSPPPAPKVVKRKVKRTYQDLAPREKSGDNDLDVKSFRPPLPSQPPPPPPPPPVVLGKTAKRGGATKDLLTSLRRKKKKQRQKSTENFDFLFSEPPALSLFPPPSPPPPPPPPPPPFFQNLFSSKKSKAKKTHLASPPPPPPPPPPPRKARPRMEARASKTKSQDPPVTTHKPPLPVKISTFNHPDDNPNSGGESPLHPIPPPPPLPPFNMPAWKFVVHGDYVRLESINNSRSGSPDLEGEDDSLTKETNQTDDSVIGAMDGGDSATALFCPSPDVDTKAGNFIARFRAGLRMEKQNSVREKQQRGRSNLGPEQSPSPT